MSSNSVVGYWEWVSVDDETGRPFMDFIVNGTVMGKVRCYISPIYDEHVEWEAAVKVHGIIESWWNLDSSTTAMDVALYLIEHLMRGE